MCRFLSLIVVLCLLSSSCFAQSASAGSDSASVVDQLLSVEDGSTCTLEDNPVQFQRQLRNGALKTQKSEPYWCKKHTNSEKECTACCERACTFYVCGKPFINLACKGLCYLTDCATK